MLLAGCRTEKKIVPTAQTSPAAITAIAAVTTGAAGTSKWDKSTIFNYGFGAPSDAWQQACGKSPAAVKDDDPCILQVMRLGNASPSAVAFYQQQKYFLVTFEEHGRVDYGQAGAPWVNMGRPTPILFLNGSPDIIEAKIPDDYKKDASYANVLKLPTATPGSTLTPLEDSPWGEYGQLTSVASTSSGQRFVVSYPLRGCRACADDGYLPIAYNFDTQGKLTGTETLAFKPK